MLRTLGGGGSAVTVVSHGPMSDIATPPRDPDASDASDASGAVDASLPPPVSVRDAVVLFVKGVMMGTADIIPGVSGGTIALIVGIYWRLLEGIKSYTPRSVLRVLRALPGLGDKRVEMWNALRAVHVDFFVPLGLGIVSAVLIMAEIMPALLAEYPSEMNALFFGLILGSVYVPYSEIPKLQIAYPFLAVVAGLFGYWVVGLPVVEGEGTLPFLFLCGAIAISAMILPGLSGSYMLKALGQYEYVLTALRDRNVVVVGVFICGIIVGVVTIVRVLGWFLKHYKGATLAALTGLMVGSLRSVWPFQTVVDGRRVNILPESFDGGVLVVVGCFVAGLVVVFGLIVADKRLGRT